MKEVSDFELDQTVNTPEGRRRIAQIRYFNQTLVVSDTERGERGGLLSIFDVDEVTEV